MDRLVTSVRVWLCSQCLTGEIISLDFSLSASFQVFHMGEAWSYLGLTELTGCLRSKSIKTHRHSARKAPGGLRTAVNSWGRIHRDRDLTERDTKIVLVQAGVHPP